MHNKYIGYDFPVNIYILCNENADTVKIRIIVLRFYGFGFYANKLVYLIIKSRPEDWFAYKTVCTSIFCLILYV